MRPDLSASQAFSPSVRIRLWYVAILLCSAVVIVRLFYLQVIRHDHYHTAALRSQLKQYEIPAERGVIVAYNGEQEVPIVLNETRYTLFADPLYIKDPEATAKELQSAIGGDEQDYIEKMKTPDTRYVVLAKKLDKNSHEKIAELELKGIGTRETNSRTYPQGSMAAQLLGFVDDGGEGKYGLEQALDKELEGAPGYLKAITDASGVPLAANKENISKAPQNGKKLVLTLDIGMQQLLEGILKEGLQNARSESGSAVVLDAQTGAVKAMANYPSYNPAEFYKEQDAKVFTNAAVSAPLEIGSVMKPLTAAAALDMGVVDRDDSYSDPGYFRIGDATITNVEEAGGAGQRTIRDILHQSLNTGATWLLKQMGGGEINEQARVRWHDYMVNHYQFGKPTGIEQGYEAEGSIPHPTDGYGLDIQYANTSFGQGMTATPLQLAAAMASILNGGTYYQPHLVEKVIDGEGREDKKQPQVVRKQVVKPEVGDTIQEFMEHVVNMNNRPAMRSGYSVGGKTGTAQIAKPEGGYYEDRYNGTYNGFVGGNEPEYIIVVRVNDPKIPGYAGSRAAAPIFARISNMLIDNFGVNPRQ